MTANLLRRVERLWKIRHTHDDDTLQEQITILRTRFEESEDGAKPLGALIHLSRATNQTIAVGGEVIEWTVETSLVLPRFEFTIPDTLPATSATIPKHGYYNIAIQLGWDTFTGGGDVWITRTRNGVETQVWPPVTVTADWQATQGGIFEATAPAIPLQNGDQIQVYVDHNDVSTHDLSYATLALYLVDRADVLTTVETYREAVLAGGPVAYWRLDEIGATAVDESGNGHDGTYDNSPTQGVDGLLANDTDKACDFDGSATDRVSVDQHADLDFLNVDFSVEAWFKPDAAITGDKSIVAHRGSTSPVNWGITYSTSGANAIFFGERDGANATGNSSAHPRGVAYHIVFTYDASTGASTLYVDGVVDANGINTNTMSSSTNDIGIGAATAGDNGADGVIDEVAVYDYVLTSDQVLDHYNIGSGN